MGGTLVSPPILSQTSIVSCKAGDSGTRSVLGSQQGHGWLSPSRFLRTESARCFLHGNSLARGFHVKSFMKVWASLCFTWLISPFLCWQEFLSLLSFFCCNFPAVLGGEYLDPKVLPSTLQVRLSEQRKRIELTIKVHRLNYQPSLLLIS